MKERQIINIAQLLSLLMTPLYLPLLGLTALMVFSYLRLLPWSYKISVLLIAYLFTIFFPSVLIRLYRHYHGWRPIHLGQKERRLVPYILTMTSFALGYYVMQLLHIPRFMALIMIAALLIQLICTLVNNFFKVSTHTAGIGGFTGGLIAFSLIFGFNPVGWLVFLIIMAGMVASARIILRQHTLAEVLTGYAIGCVAGFVVILL